MAGGITLYTADFVTTSDFEFGVPYAWNPSTQTWDRMIPYVWTDNKWTASGSTGAVMEQTYTSNDLQFCDVNGNQFLVRQD